MKRRKKKVDLLIPVLSAVAVVLAVILIVLLMTGPKTEEGTGETGLPALETTVPDGDAQMTEPGKQTQPSESAGIPEVTQMPEDIPASTENSKETVPTQKETEPEETKNSSQEGTEPETTKDPTQEGTEPVMNGAEVKTPYCVLKIPEEWVGDISVQIIEQEWNTQIDFYGNLSGEKILLYTVHFGGAAGDPVGAWKTDEDIMMDVTVVVHEIAENADWSTEELDTVYAMQESVNYVLNDLAGHQAFLSI